MNKQRYQDLQRGLLTPNEISEGWHWCPEMDGLLCIRGSEGCFCSEEGYQKRESFRKELSDLDSNSLIGDNPLKTSALRDNLGKPQLSFILEFPTAVTAHSRVKELGAIKYERDNWKKAGKPDEEYIDACIRHLMAFMEGEIFAQDTGNTHLAHAAWNLFALQDLNYKGITHEPGLFKAMCEYWKLRRGAEKGGETFMSVEEFMDKRDGPKKVLKLSPKVRDHAITGIIDLLGDSSEPATLWETHEFKEGDKVKVFSTAITKGGNPYGVVKVPLSSEPEECNLEDPMHEEASRYFKLRQGAFDLGFTKFPSFEEFQKTKQESLDADDSVYTEELLADIAERKRILDDLVSDTKDFIDPNDQRVTIPKFEDPVGPCEGKVNVQRYKDGTGSIEDYCPKIKLDMPDPKGTKVSDISKDVGNWFADAADNATRQAAVDLIHSVSDSAEALHFEKPLTVCHGQTLSIDYANRMASVLEGGDVIQTAKLCDKPIEVDSEFTFEHMPADKTLKCLDDAREKAAEGLARGMGTSKEHALDTIMAVENTWREGLGKMPAGEAVKALENNQGYLIGKTDRPVAELIAEALDNLIVHPSHTRFIKQKQDEAFQKGYQQAKEDFIAGQPDTAPCEDPECDCRGYDDLGL